MSATSTLTLSRGSALTPAALTGAAFAAMPLLAALLSPLVGHDDASVRACVMLGELAVVGVLGSGVRTAWAAMPRALRAAVGVWLLAMAVTTATAVHVPAAVFRTAEWAVHLVAAASLWRWIGDAARARDVVRGAACGALALALVAALLWCVGVGWRDLSGPSTPPPMLGSVRAVGFVALAAVALGLGAWPRRARVPAGAVAAWAAGWAVLCWTGGRGSLLAAAAATLAWAGLARPDRRVLLTLAAGIAAGALASLALPDDGRTMGLARFVADLAPREGYSTNRTQVWAFLLDAAAARPWRGLGPDGAAFALAGHTHAHNTAVQAFAEWGAVGALAFGGVLLAALGGLLRRAWRHPAAPSAAVAAWWLAASLNGLLDGLFYGAGTLALLAVSLAAGAPPAPSGRRARRSRAFAAGALACGALALLHLAASGARYAGGTPAPDSARARLALASPTATRATELLWWGKDWAADHPAAARAVARWGQRHSRLPWVFLDLEADLRLAAGDAAAARALRRRGAQAQRATLAGR